MNRIKIVAFTGRAGSGKTTAAQHLVDAYGATRISFAEPLRRIAKDVFEFTDEQLRTSTGKEAVDRRYGFSPRESLIRLGRSARENISPDVWVGAAFNSILRRGSGLYVIDDLRYPNEALRLAESGGFLIKMVCEGYPHPPIPSESSVDAIRPELIDATVVRTYGCASKEDTASVIDSHLLRYGLQRPRQTSEVRS